MKRLVDKKEVDLIKRRLLVQPSDNRLNCVHSVAATNDIGEPELVCKVSRGMEFVTMSNNVCNLWEKEDA